MKNTTDLQDDGSRWRTLRGTSPESVFRSWGATELYQHPNDSDWRWMIRIDGSWHYAHTDRVSCYCAAESFGVETGEQAYWASKVNAAQRNVHHYEQELANAHARLSECQNQYAMALRKDTI